MEVRVIWHPAWHPECLLALQQMYSNIHNVYCATYTIYIQYTQCVYIIYINMSNVYKIYKIHTIYIVLGTQSGFLPSSCKTFLLAVNCKWSAATLRPSLFHIALLFRLNIFFFGFSCHGACLDWDFWGIQWFLKGFVGNERDF